MAEWRNWAGHVTADVEIVAVRDVEHIQEICAAASGAGRRVEPIGASHSFTAIGQPVDIQLQMDNLSGVISADTSTSRAWIRSGTRLSDAVVELHTHGLALSNQGDYDRRTMAGASSTGTHGTGVGLTGFAGMVRGVELVLADGTLMRVTDTENAGLLPAMSLTLGALGVITAIEYQCEPSYLLTATEEPASFHEVLDTIQQHVDANDHFEFFWFLDTARVLAKTSSRHRDEGARAPKPAWKDKLENDILSNRFYQVVNSFTTRVPRATAAINQLSALALSGKRYTDWSHIVFPTERNVRFRESEFSLPRAAADEALRRLQQRHRANRNTTSFPVEVRFTGPDDRWLSTSYDRESVYIAVHQYIGRPHETYFRSFWDIVSTYEARPHWARCTTSMPTTCGRSTRSSTSSLRCATVSTPAEPSATPTWPKFSAPDRHALGVLR